MSYINPTEWTPVDQLILEKNAILSVRNTTKNNLVIAGPGSGKTELLAQKASFLLETNSCEHPSRILAISFKRDAAKNLKDRVNKRCKDYSYRFSSLTYDSFSKKMLDNFLYALPKEIRPTSNYEILSDSKTINDLYKSVDLNYFQSHNKSKIEKLIETSLPINGDDGDDGDYNYLNKLWHTFLFKYNQSLLTFTMINRLVSYLFELNPILINYLQITYKYLFLDEFQDTTAIQYELIKICFFNSKSVITAVGDDKQRIMVWAGALKNIFSNYKTDFNSAVINLTMNFRSAPRIIELQKFLVSKLMNQSFTINSSNKWNNNDGIIEWWKFKDYNQEAKKTADFIKGYLENENIKPEDICIIVKQKVQSFAEEIIFALSNKGIKSRNQTLYQDILTEEIIHLCISYFKFYANRFDAENREYLLNIIFKIKHISEEYEMHEENIFYDFIKTNNIKDVSDLDSIKNEISKFIDYIGIDQIKANYPQYNNQKYFNKLIADFGKFLFDELNKSNDLQSSLDSILGKETIPIMTIHKSKGLEYDTVIFLGLEDSSFWSFNTQQDEDICSFFVALSRAKRRVIFTACQIRNTGRYGSDTKQSINNIKPFYDVLEESKLVSFLDFSSEV